MLLSEKNEIRTIRKKYRFMTFGKIGIISTYAVETAVYATIQYEYGTFDNSIIGCCYYLL